MTTTDGEPRRMTESNLSPAAPAAKSFARFLAGAKERLAARRATTWIIALGVTLAATSLAGGLAADDYLHAIELLRVPFPTPHEGHFDLFRFASGDPHTARALMDVGEFAWTSDPTARFGFFRPLTTLTHVFDYWAWPRSPALMHAQSLAWFAAVLAGAAAVYRRLLAGTWIAGLALLLYALDDTHGPVVGWLANRNSLVALAFSLAALWMHDRWRREGWKPGAWAAPVVLAVALLAGESALAIVAYLVAYALHLERGTWRARLLTLAPYAAVVVAWRAVYTRLGYGVSGSGVYFDPGHSVLAYLAQLPHRFPFLLVGQIGLPRSDAAEAYEYMAPSAMAWMTVFALLFLAVIAWAVAPLWRRDPVTRFFATGMLLATFPICGAFPSDRLLVFVGIGAMGLIAQLIATAATTSARALATFLVVVHVVLAPPLLALRSRFIDYQLPTDFALRTFPSSPEIASKSVVLVNPPHDLFQVYIEAIRAFRGEPRPLHLWGLASVTTWVDVTRVDAHTLLIHPEHGFLEHEGQRMFRSAEHPLTPGSEVRLSGMTATVLDSTAAGQPSSVLFHFDAPLEDPSLVWLEWTRQGYAPWPLPAVGATVRLPAFDLGRFTLDVEDRLWAGG